MSRCNLCQRKEPSFAHLKTFSDAHANVGMTQEDGKSLTTVLTSMKKGLKKKKCLVMLVLKGYGVKCGSSMNAMS
jgi:hypothetical protein